MKLWLFRCLILLVFSTPIASMADSSGVLSSPASKLKDQLEKPYNPIIDKLKETEPQEIVRSSSVTASRYLGQGTWEMEIRNDGNSYIVPGELSFQATYYQQHNSFTAEPVLNSEKIATGQSFTISQSALAATDGECADLNQIYVEVRNTVTGYRAGHAVIDIDFADVDLRDVSLEDGILVYAVENLVPYPVKVTVALDHLEVWDVPKPPKSRSAWDLFKDFITGNGSFDSSGLQPEELKCSISSPLVLGHYQLNPRPVNYKRDPVPINESTTVVMIDRDHFQPLV